MLFVDHVCLLVFKNSEFLPYRSSSPSLPSRVPALCTAIRGLSLNLLLVVLSQQLLSLHMCFITCYLYILEQIPAHPGRLSRSVRHERKVLPVPCQMCSLLKKSRLRASVSIKGNMVLLVKKVVTMSTTTMCFYCKDCSWLGIEISFFKMKNSQVVLRLTVLPW